VTWAFLLGETGPVFSCGPISKVCPKEATETQGRGGDEACPGSEVWWCRSLVCLALPQKMKRPAGIRCRHNQLRLAQTCVDGEKKGSNPWRFSESKVRSAY